MKNTFWENVFVCKNFLLTVKKTSCIENIRFLGGLLAGLEKVPISPWYVTITHLKSYTNTAITDIAGNSLLVSPETPRERRCLRIECRYRRMEWRVFVCLMMFHNVLRVFHDVLRCLASRATIRIGDSVAADRDTAGIADDSADIGNDAAWIVNIAAKMIPC